MAAFFGCVVTPEKPVSIDEAVTLTAAVLEAQPNDGKRALLSVKVGGMDAIALCSLRGGIVENATLSLMFESGATFATTHGRVHLSGYYHQRLEDEDEMEEGQGLEGSQQYSDSDEVSGDYGDNGDIDENGDDNDDDDDVDEPEEEPVVEKKRSREPAPPRNVEQKKPAVTTTTTTATEDASKKSNDNQEVHSMKIKGSTLQWINISQGGGKAVRKGGKIRIRYTGRFASNNKIFDTSGRKCYSFVAGKGEVITGLDAGVKGMMPGGRRKIFIPSELAYGAEGAPPDIPPNAALVFEVEMVGYGKPKKTARNQKRQSSPPRMGADDE